MKIIFKPEAFKKFRAYILGIDYEISGFGKVEKEGDNLVITDVKIFPQVVTAANTILDVHGLAQFFDDLTVAGEDIGKWKLWWHSHVNMEAHFSGTDYATIDEFDTELPEENWMLSIVANKMGDAYARVDIFQPIKCSINNIPWDIELDDQNLEVDVKQEILDKVTIRTGKKEPLPPASFFGKRKPSVLSPADRAKILRDFPHLAMKLLPPESEILDGELIYDGDGRSTFFP